MSKHKARWVQSVKCYMCGKTGKVPDPNNSEKEIKCETCHGTGFLTTSGTLST